MRLRGAAPWIAMLLFVAGCSSYRSGLAAIKVQSRGELIPVRKSDFPTGDPREGANGAPGSRVLAFAAQGHDAVAEAVHEYGIPDGIGIGGGSGLAVELAYLQPPVLRTIALVGYWRTTSSERPLTDAEVAQVDPELRLAAEAETLRERIAAEARLQTVGLAILRRLPPHEPSNITYGLLLADATPQAARLYGGDPTDAELIVVWVEPAGPQRDRLRPGDRITAVDGQTPSGKARWNGPVHLTLRRDGTTADVVIEPEQLPRAVSYVVVANDLPNALAVPGAVGVTTGLLKLAPTDDMLAAAVGHEVAHITLGHTDREVTPTSVLKGIVGTVLLPAEIAAPGSSTLVTGLIQGVDNRFNRDQERDADRLGLHYAKDAGYDPAAALPLLDALDRQQPDYAIDEFFDVHPPFPERRGLIEQELRSLQ